MINERGAPKKDLPVANKVNFRFLKTWVLASALTMLFYQKEIGLPIFEGWVALVVFCLAALVFVIPIFWALKPTLRATANINWCDGFTEVLVGWIVLVLCGFFTVKSAQVIVLNITEPKQVITTERYDVVWRVGCNQNRASKSRKDCMPDGYYLLLGRDEKHGLEINRSTYKKLKYNSYKTTVTKDRMTKSVERNNPITVTYKPKSKRLFKVEAVSQ